VAAFIEFGIIAIICFASIDVLVVEVSAKAFQHLVQIVVRSVKCSRAKGESKT